MAKLLVEEPDALMCALPDLWEPWVSNHPEPPGPRRFRSILTRFGEIDRREKQRPFNVRFLLNCEVVSRTANSRQS
jgi:hypothetical protein